jgi:hypothetical protein
MQDRLDVFEFKGAVAPENLLNAAATRKIIDDGL